LALRRAASSAVPTAGHSERQQHGDDHRHERGTGDPASPAPPAGLLKEHIRLLTLTPNFGLGSLARRQLGRHPLTASIIAISSLLR
jgi:hypothetical protein